MFESALEPVNATLVELANLQPGQRVLASGCGEPAAGAARRVGPAGSVVVADGEDRDLADAGFDAALYRFGLSFVPDVAATLQRLAALLAPGGRLAAAVWGPPARCPALSLAWATMRLFMESPSVAPGAAGLFGLGGEGVIDDELNFAGFTDVRSRRLAVSSSGSRLSSSRRSTRPWPSPSTARVQPCRASAKTRCERPWSESLGRGPAQTLGCVSRPRSWWSWEDVRHRKLAVH